MFFLSILTINVFKSSRLGVGVYDAEVTSLVTITSCFATSFPFFFLILEFRLVSLSCVLKGGMWLLIVSR